MFRDEDESIFIELLKASEDYCKRHNLSTADDVASIFGHFLEDYEYCIPEDKEKVISIMKNAALYCQIYDEQADEMEHWAFGYDEEEEEPHVWYASLFDKRRIMVTNYVPADEFFYIIRCEGVEQMKNFKCFRE